MSIISGVSSIEELFATLTSDDRLARALLYKENLQVARVVGLRVRKNQYTEVELVSRARRHFMAQIGPRPCSGCVLSGRRWFKINQGEPMTYRLDRSALREAYHRADECIEDALENLKSLHPHALIREAMIGEVPDVEVTGSNIDGRHGTLGTATTYNTGTEDLDLGADRWVSALLEIDKLEHWDYDFFFTVFSHEFLHILGLDHAPPTVADDILLPFYVRDRRDYGVWTMSELDRRHIGALPA